jgi:hypothetical protein
MSAIGPNKASLPVPAPAFVVKMKLRQSEHKIYICIYGKNFHKSFDWLWCVLSGNEKRQSEGDYTMNSSYHHTRHSFRKVTS